MTADIISLARARQARADRRLNCHWSDKIEEGRRIASERLNALLVDAEAEMRLGRLFDGDDLPPGGNAA